MSSLINGSTSNQMSSSGIIWSPYFDEIINYSHKYGPIRAVFSAFIKDYALKMLLSRAPATEQTFVVRWRTEDILTGASDLSIYHTLKSAGHKLYINESLHAKIVFYKSNRALIGSGNLTGRGMGLTEKYNLESASIIELQETDWQVINRLISGSIEVSEDLYCDFEKHILQEKEKKKSEPTVEYDFSKHKKKYSLNSLPDSLSPESFWEAFSEGESNTNESLSNPVIWHDKALFNLPAEIQTFEEALPHLCNSLLANPIVQELISLLKVEQSMNFGAVSKWLHDKCDDVPIPYRSEVKDKVSILYNWLTVCVDEIDWHVPGRRSQVIRWNP